MGTRCLTIVKDKDDEDIVTMYRQFDGYPDGHGKELASFLDGFFITNGFKEEDKKRAKVANTMGCLAAQLVAHFKNSNPLGNIYLFPNHTESLDCAYTYIVRPEGNTVCITVIPAPLMGC